MPAQSPALDGSRPMIGVLLMLAAMAGLPMIDVIAKFLGQQGLPILMIVWARLSFGTLMTLPFALRLTPPIGLLPQRPAFHALRALFLILATFSFFLSLKFLPIADALAIFFVQPLVVTVLSALVLKEHVGPRRWAAVFAGFIGTLIIIRPGFVAPNPGSFLALAAGCMLAVYFVMTRRISGQAPAMLTTFHTNLMGTAMLSGVIPLVWQMPSPTQWALLASLAAIATIGHFFIVRAYDFAEASLLAPLAYMEMIGSTLLGYLFFGDFPDGWTLFGVAILIGCALYISWRERNTGRPLPPDPGVHP